LRPEAPAQTLDDRLSVLHVASAEIVPCSPGDPRGEFLFKLTWTSKLGQTASFDALSVGPLCESAAPRGNEHDRVAAQPCRAQAQAQHDWWGLCRLCPRPSEVAAPPRLAHGWQDGRPGCAQSAGLLRPVDTPPGGVGFLRYIAMPVAQVCSLL